MEAVEAEGNVLCTTPTFSQLHTVYTVRNHRPSARGLDLRQANSHTNSKLLCSYYMVQFRAHPIYLMEQEQFKSCACAGR